MKKGLLNSWVAGLLIILSVVYFTSRESDKVSEEFQKAEALQDYNTDKGEPVKLKTASKEPYGTFLTDSKGKAVYLFTADEKMRSNCNNACAEAWPPVISDGKPQVGNKVKSDMLGSIKRKDGQMQVTYNGWPLYYFQQDKTEGEVKGQDIHSYGGGWYLVSPEGKKIESGKTQM